MSNQFDAKLFVEAIDAIAKEKGVSQEAVVNALRDAFSKAYARLIGIEEDKVNVNISVDPANIEIFVYKDVIADDEDDETAYDIPLSKAKKINPKLKVGDKCRVDVQLSDLTKMTAMVIKSVLKQKIADAEKVALFNDHKDKIGEMITGEVEKCEERGCLVNIGRTSVYLTRRDMIGDEHYQPRDNIRVYIADVSNSEKGPQIKISRSDPGFIRRLFEEEVHDIYDGTVIIKNVAREAGVRSKIAVYSNDPNVDPIGSCIGINGSCIQKITAQLGNSREKEKIDVILYSSNPALFIIDALRPATVTNIYVNVDEHKAIAIVPDGQLSLAIGRKGANARVACKLTGYNIDIKEEKELQNLIDEGYTFLTPDEVRKEDSARLKKEMYDRYLATIKAKQNSENLSNNVDNVAIEKSKPINITDDLIAEPEKAEEKPTKVEETAASVKEEVKVEKVEEPVETPKASKEVKTTTTLESLEKELEEEKKQEQFKAIKKESRRPRKITDEELPHEEVKIDPLKNSMPIYTDEELEELEALEEEDDSIYDDDYDFDDFDSYYDDDK